MNWPPRSMYIIVGNTLNYLSQRGRDCEKGCGGPLPHPPCHVHTVERKLPVCPRSRYLPPFSPTHRATPRARLVVPLQRGCQCPYCIGVWLPKKIFLSLTRVRNSNRASALSDLAGPTRRRREALTMRSALNCLLIYVTTSASALSSAMALCPVVRLVLSVRFPP